MQNPQKFDRIISSLVNSAISMSPDDNSFRLAAVAIKGTKMVSPICHNVHRNSCHGLTTGSLHAETNVVFNLCGKNINYSPKIGWSLSKSCFKQWCFEYGRRAR